METVAVSLDSGGGGRKKTQVGKRGTRREPINEESGRSSSRHGKISAHPLVRLKKKSRGRQSTTHSLSYSSTDYRLSLRANPLGHVAISV